MAQCDVFKFAFKVDKDAVDWDMPAVVESVARYHLHVSGWFGLS